MSAALLVPAVVLADGQALAKQSGCIACHDVTKKMAGPAFKDVAAKYKADSGAAAKLEKKVRGGGAGSFGDTPMPAQYPSVSDADIKNIVAWILTLG